MTTPPNARSSLHRRTHLLAIAASAAFVATLTALATAGALIVGLPVYGFYSMRSNFNERVTALEHELQAVRAQNTSKVQEVAADLKYVAEKMDITTHELEGARKLAETLKQEHAQTTQRLRSELASNSREMNRLRQDSNSRFEEVRQDTSTKIGAVVLSSTRPP